MEGSDTHSGAPGHPDDYPDHQLFKAATVLRTFRRRFPMLDRTTRRQLRQRGE